MRRPLLAVACAFLAALALAPRSHADTPTNGGGLSKVTHDGTLQGSGTPSNPLGVIGGIIGDITGVVAGAGLTGGATSGTATVDVAATAGGGITVAADSIGLLTSCSTGNVLSWGGSSWACANGVVNAISGTTNTVLKLTGTNVAGNSSITDNGTTATVGSVFAVTESNGRLTAGTIQTSNSSGPQIIDAAASSTTPVFAPNRGSTGTGMGAQASGNISLIANNAEVARISQGINNVAALAISSAQVAGGTLGAEILDATSWTSTGWTGSWAGGWTHTIGNTTALSRTMTNTIGQRYQVTYTVTSRTAGSFSVSIGGSVAIASITATGAVGPQTLSTNGDLVITPTTDFDGTIVLSVKLISSVAGLVTLSNSSGAVAEIRGDGTNIFEGLSAGNVNTTGTHNAGFGRTALNFNTTGINNNAFGSAALAANTTGNSNNAVGRQALTANTTGGGNNAMGVSALGANTTGSSNVAIGDGALAATTTGSNNSAIGPSAGRFIANGSTSNITSSSSTYFGALTKALADGDANETVVGYNATGAGSNTATLGNTSVTATILQGNVNVDSATGFLWSSSSTDPTTTKDTGIARNAAGVVEINSGTAGTLRDLTARKYIAGSASGPTWSSGTGSPEGAVTAPVGSMYSRTDGGAGTSEYRKESGTGNTGWAAATSLLTACSANQAMRWTGTAWACSAKTVFDVRDYGAICDGSANDTIAIQAALDAAGAVSGTAFIPPTVAGCTFSNLVIWPKSQLRGDSMYRSRLLRRTGSTGTAIREMNLSEGNSLGATGIWISDLFVDGNSTTGDGINVGNTAMQLSTLAGISNVAVWNFTSGTCFNVDSNASSFDYLWAGNCSTGIKFEGGGANMMHSMFSEWNSTIDLYIHESDDHVYGVQIEEDSTAAASGSITVDGFDNVIDGAYISLGTNKTNVVVNAVGANRTVYTNVVLVTSGHTFSNLVYNATWSTGTGSSDTHISRYEIGEGTTISNWYINQSTGHASKRSADLSQAYDGTFGGTLGVTGLATLTGGFTLGADSSAGSHKITSLTNGSSAQDAAAFGQIGTAVNTAVSGTTNKTTKFSGTNAVGNGWASDDGTTWGVAGKFAIAESSGAAVLSSTLEVDSGTTVFGTASADPLAVAQNATGVTAANRKGITIAEGGTFDATAATRESYALSAIVNSTRSAGANALTNYAIFADATGAQNNYALFANNGLVLMNGATTLGSTLAVNGNTTLGDATTDTTTVNGATTITGPASSTTTLAVSGGTTLALGVTGNASVSGTGHVGGNFDVATSKFTVAAASGDTTGAGALTIAGTTTLNGTLLVGDTNTDVARIRANVTSVITSAATNKPAATSCGSGGTVISGGSLGFLVAVGTSATGCTLTFASPFDDLPACTITRQGGSGWWTPEITSNAAGAITIQGRNATGLAADISSSTLHVQCIGTSINPASP